ncbi:MAG TPA: hypothetical protein VE821_02240, partial [Pyrinomonadaceae bacterium]|nr:hypothetical protein [Pyrinomonadaceae bacterium]
MQKPDERHHHREVLPEHRAFKTRARAHEHRRQEVNDERISQTHARELRVLRREVVARSETADDCDVKRQIADVRVNAREDS